jgi:hypothetical protein
VRNDFADTVADVHFLGEGAPAEPVRAPEEPPPPAVIFTSNPSAPSWVQRWLEAGHA